MSLFKVILILLFVQQTNSYAQSIQDSTNLQKPQPDTVIKASPRLPVPLRARINKTSFNHLLPDTSILQKLKKTDTVISSYSGRPVIAKTYQSLLNYLLSQNKFINYKKTPVFFVTTTRSAISKEYLFYLVSGIVLAFGFFKLFYARYFHNIFRVFFNTSLRQNQLTDLLLQARLPSLIFNIIFIIISGLYVWLLLAHYYLGHHNPGIYMLFYCVLGVALIYIVKFCVLKFTGWITGLNTALNTYIFVVFLINKIIGIALIPLILVLAFSPPVFFSAAVILSSLSIGVIFIMRFFRSYSLLQQHINISLLHFLLYIVSLEILPLLVIYTLLMRTLTKV